MRKGFTLVELSIVLVIIGLLTGGVLVAQSMVNTTKIQAFIRQIQQIDIVVANFGVKYNSIPGDSPVLEPQGDGDGVIEDIYDDRQAVEFSGEIENFWVHLSASGFDPQRKYTNVISSTFNADPNALNAPVSIIGKNSTISLYGYADDGFANTYKISDVHLVTNANRSVFPAYCCGFAYPGKIASVKSSDIIAIDMKIDDGLIALDNKKNVFGYFYGAGFSRDCLKSDDECALFIRMLSQTGS